MNITQIDFSRQYVGSILRLDAEYGFLSIDNFNLSIQVFFHKLSCRNFKFESLKVRDRMLFHLQPSEKYPGKLFATGLRRVARHLPGIKKVYETSRESYLRRHPTV